MNCILLLIEQQVNSRLLKKLLCRDYEVLSFKSKKTMKQDVAKLLDKPFDMCIVDECTLEAVKEKILQVRNAEMPVFLPFVLLRTNAQQKTAIDDWEFLVDEIIDFPLQEFELCRRLRVLLRSRSMSLQLKKAQEQAQRALIREKELNELKSRFISTVSHEFRNPLSVISGGMQVLTRYNEQLTEEKKRDIFQHMENGVNKMIMLLEDILTISQVETGKLNFNPQLFDLEAFCGNLIKEVELAFSNHYIIDFVYNGNSQASLDKQLIQHILTNLLSNAIKYSFEETQVSFKVDSQAKEIIFEIQDRGIGIPETDRCKIFDSFYRASNASYAQGTGLGLAIVKHCVDLHQGAIALESQVGVGTTFTVTIPNNLNYCLMDLSVDR